jgi:hypothetical protein
MKKKTIAIIAVAATVSVAGIGAADAASKKTVVKTATVAATRPSIGGAKAMGSNPIASVLAGLVTKGTITQAQSDAITAALTAARPALGANPGKDGIDKMDKGSLFIDKKAIILSTLGIDEATLQAGMQAGKSLATIAGTKTTALITALVAAQSKAIDDAVTAGKITAAQATTAKASLSARVTAEVNEVAPLRPAGAMGMGRGHGHGFGGPAGAPGTATPNTNN